MNVLFSRWGSGREVQSMDVEVGVLEYLLDERAEGLTVSNRQLQDKALELARKIPGMEDFKVSIVLWPEIEENHST